MSRYFKPMVSSTLSPFSIVFIPIMANTNTINNIIIIVLKHTLGKYPDQIKSLKGEEGGKPLPRAISVLLRAHSQIKYRLSVK